MRAKLSLLGVKSEDFGRSACSRLSVSVPDQEHLDLELLIVSEVLVQGHNCGASRSSWSQRHTDESDEDEAADSHFI